MDETYSTVAPECPYCGHTHEHDGGFFFSESLTEYECESCGKAFDMEVSHSTYWRCTPKAPTHDS